MRLAALVFFLGASLCAAQRTHAQPADAPAASSATRATAPTAPLPLVLSLGNSRLDPEAIRAAIELELKRPVTLAKITRPEGADASAGASLSVAVHGDKTATVSYREDNGLTRSRSIPLPQDRARVPEVIALLSGNLSRDEAAELLASLAAKRDAEAAPPPAGTTPEAPGPPAPAPAPAAPPSAPPKPKAKAAEHAASKQGRGPDSAELQRAPYPLFDLTLAHPLGVLPHTERYVLNGELGLFYGRVGAVEGAAINVMVLRTDRDVRGTSFGTFYNDTGGTTYGATASGLINRGQDVTGAIFGGIATFHRDLIGCAGAGISDFGRDVEGCTIAGVISSARDFSGFQFAGLVNHARYVDGVQLAGLTNIAARVRGMQIGVVNIAGDVEGMQLGVVNVARHVSGASVGVISVAGNERVQPVLWGSTFMPVNLALKFQLGLLYTQFGGGISTNDDTYIFEAGLGMHIPVGPVFLEPGASYSEQHAIKRSFSSGQIEHVHYRLAAGLDLRVVSPFIGLAYMQRLAHDLSGVDSSAGRFEGFAGVAFF